MRANNDPAREARLTIASAVPIIERRAESRKLVQTDRKDLKAFGQAIRFLRTYLGQSQAFVAATCGCSFKTISNIERAQNWPSAALYSRLCRQFRVEVGPVYE
jgi:DNA-binding XRE family transcriptional regulator